MGTPYLENEGNNNTYTAGKVIMNSTPCTDNMARTYFYGVSSNWIEYGMGSDIE